MKTVFVLFETDDHRSVKTRIFLGVFDTKVKAIDEAKANNCYRNDVEVEIIETDINKFNEL